MCKGCHGAHTLLVPRCARPRQHTSWLLYPPTRHTLPPCLARYRSKLRAIKEAFKESTERDIEALRGALEQYKGHVERLECQKQLLLKQVLHLEVKLEARDKAYNEVATQLVAAKKALAERAEPAPAVPPLPSPMPSPMRGPEAGGGTPADWASAPSVEVRGCAYTGNAASMRVCHWNIPVSHSPVLLGAHARGPPCHVWSSTVTHPWSNTDAPVQDRGAVGRPARAPHPPISLLPGISGPRALLL